MDPVTQGLLGAAVPQAFASKNHHRKAAVIGAFGGMAPDLDVLIRSSDDPLLFLDFHRHFTHSVLFIPIGGTLVAAALFLLVRKSFSFRQTWLFATAGYATHGLLDTCTSYGTYLLWPFTGTRYAWDNVAVVDPFLTLPLALLVSIAFLKRRNIWARLGLVLVLLYLLGGVVQRNRAMSNLQEMAVQRGHRPEIMVAKPTLGNLWLWRCIYEWEGFFYVDAVWILPLAQPVWYQGEAIAKFNPQEAFPGLDLTSVHGKDLERFDHFSAGFLALHPDDPLVVGDIRYALVPNQIYPLWGVRLDPSAAHEHVRYETFREITPERKQTYFRMLRGQL